MKKFRKIDKNYPKKDDPLFGHLNRKQRRSLKHKFHGNVPSDKTFYNDPPPATDET